MALVNAGEPDGGEISVQIVPARQLVQVDGILAQVPNPPRQGYARVTRLSGTGRFIAYAVVNEGAFPGEGSGDGAYVASDGGF